MSVVSYTLRKCTKCLKCIKVCPTGAMSMRDSRVQIDSEKCINCGACIDACNHQGLQAKGSTLVDIENYDYTVALVPTAVFGDCASLSEVQTLFAAIRKLGFDEVIDLSKYDGRLYDEHSRFLEVDNKRTRLISSFCPVINKLIENHYPMLFSNMIPFEDVAQLAAKRVRNEKTDKGNVGIFLLCECIAKLPFARYPYGNKNTEIDHAVSLADIFPDIRKNRDEQKDEVRINANGLRRANTQLFAGNRNQRNCVVADGLTKIENALDLLEFGQIKNGEYFHLTNCINGCIGGNLLWGNPFDKDVNARKLILEADAEAVNLTSQELYSEVKSMKMPDSRTSLEKLEEFAALNKQLEHLPGFDCGACGYPSCRAMAEEIVKGEKEIADCKLLR